MRAHAALMLLAGGAGHQVMHVNLTDPLPIRPPRRLLYPVDSTRTVHRNSAPPQCA